MSMSSQQSAIRALCEVVDKGCDVIEQLPTLGLLSHLYKVVAICDVSAESVKHCASKFHIPRTYSTCDELLKDGEVELVMILTADEYHAPYAIAAADAGKAVFLEKPMALTHADARAIIAAKERNTTTMFIGYMRRYAPALAYAKQEVDSMEHILHVRVRDMSGTNQTFVDQSGTYSLAFTDVSADDATDKSTRTREIAKGALGSRADDKALESSLRFLGSLGSHDLSAMRELLGGKLPTRCVGATRAKHGPFYTALLEYEDEGFTAIYESGIDSVASFDAYIEVIGEHKRVKVSYDTPYVKGLPITVEVREFDKAGNHVERVVRPTYTDTYTLELEELYECVRNGKPVKTTPEDAAQDLLIFDMILSALK